MAKNWINKFCKRCGIQDNLTKHHLKNSYGSKTGEIEILCRKCHDIAEKEYIDQGIITTSFQEYVLHMRRNVKPIKGQFLNLEPLIPFYFKQRSR